MQGVGSVYVVEEVAPVRGGVGGGLFLGLGLGVGLVLGLVWVGGGETGGEGEVV